MRYQPTEGDFDTPKGAQSGDCQRTAVSVVLLTLNGSPRLEKTLEALANQDYSGPVEIVHVDSGSSDGTLELTRRLGLRTHHIRAADFHHSRTATGLQLGLRMTY